MLNAESFPIWFDVIYEGNRLGMKLLFPRGFSANLILIIWSLSSSVIAYGFLANLRVMLLTPVLEAAVDTPEDIIGRGLTPFIEWNAKFYIDFLKRSPNPVYQELADIMAIPKDEEAETIMIIEDMFKAGTHVYLNYDIDKKFGDRYLSKTILEGMSPWAVLIQNKKWPLNDEFAKHILRYQQVCMICLQKINFSSC